MASLLSWGKKKVKQAEQAVGHAVQGVERQVNPVDNGKTFSNSRGNQQPNGQPAPSSFQQLTKAAPHLVKNVVQALPVLPGGVSADFVKNTQKLVVQPTLRSGVEIAATAVNKPIVLPKRAAPLVGKDTTVKPIQQDVKGVTEAVRSGKQTLPILHTPIPASLAPEYGAADAILHIAQDAPLVGVAAKGVKAVAEPAVAEALASRTPLNEVGAVGKNVPSPKDSGLEAGMNKAKADALKQGKALTDDEAKVQAVKNLVSSESSKPITPPKFNSAAEALQDPAFKARMDAATAQTKAPGTSNNLYHTTSADNLADIRANGLQPGQTKRFQASGDGLHFGANEETASHYGKPGDVMIRTKSSYKPANIEEDALAGGTGAYKVKDSVPASALEVKTGGKWKPLTKTPEGLNLPTLKESRFASRVSTSEEVSPELQGQVAARDVGYNPVRNEDQLAAAEARFSKGYKKQAASVNEELAGKEINDQHVADAIQAIKTLDEKGGTANHSLATDITEKLSKHLTKAGQKIQAARLLGNRTPQGMLFGARRYLAGKNIELTEELDSKLRAHIDKIKSLPAGSEERDRAMAELVDTVSRQVPSNAADKATALWKAGLLTGVKTQSGNALSNIANLSLKTVSDVPSTAFDRLIALKTGERAKALTVKGNLSGTAEGIEKGWKALRTGIDERDLEHLKYDTQRVNFGDSTAGKFADRYVNTVFNLMGAADRPYYYRQLRVTLNDLAKTEAINKGLKGADRAEYIKQFTANPPEKAFQTATNAAEKSIFANDTTLSKMAAGLRQAAASREGITGKLASAALNVLMPFTKVPSAVITRLFDYTPVGAVKEILKQIDKGEFDQRALSEALGEASTGTGALAIGYALYKNGLITGDYPTNDKKQQELWKLEGKQPNSIKIGGKWLSFNYTSPIGQLFQTGGQIADAVSKGSSAVGAIESGILGAGKTVLSQSFLQGVQGALDAINDPDRSLRTYVQSQGSSIVPTLVGDIAKATDNTQRQVRGVGQAIEARIPGLEKNLPAKRDVLGNTIPRPSSAVNTLTNPFRPIDIRNNPAAGQELQRLYDKLGPSDAPSFAPPTTVTVGQTKVPLQGKLLADFQAKSGKLINQGIDNLLKNSDYQRMNDADKSAAINKVIRAARGATTSAMASEIAPNDKLKAPTGLTQETISNPGSLGTDLTTTTDNRKAKYQKDLAGFNKLTNIEKQIQKPKIAKEGVEVKYPKDVVSLYGQSAKNIQLYFNNNPNDTQTKKQLAALDNDLYSSGLITKKKVAGDGSVASSSSGSKKGGSKKASTFKAPTGLGKSSVAANKSASSAVKGATVKARKVASSRVPKTRRPKIAKIKTPKFA